MKQIFIYFGIVVVISLAVDIGLNIYKKKLNDKLMNLLLSNNLKEFDELLAKKSTKFFVTVYSSLVLKMNKAALTKDTKLMNEVMSEISKIKTNEPQRLFVYSKAFSFYLAEKDSKRVDLCYKKIQECKDSPTKQYIQMVYNTIVEKKYDYIDVALSMIGQVSAQDEENIKLLIGTMYQNKGDENEAQKYF